MQVAPKPSVIQQIKGRMREEADEREQSRRELRRAVAMFWIGVVVVTGGLAYWSIPTAVIVLGAILLVIGGSATRNS